jgi:hypothetical protein
MFSQTTPSGPVGYPLGGALYETHVDGSLFCQTPEEREQLFRTRLGETMGSEALLVQQLHEWVKIEDDYDQIPWTIADPGEEERLFDKLDEAVQRHTTHARAGPPTSLGRHELQDMYLTRRGLDNGGMPLKTHDGYDYGWSWKHWDPSTINWPENHILDTYGGHPAFFPSDFDFLRRPGRLNEDNEGIEDNEGRIIVYGEVTNKGANYMKASTPYGSCYINMKFTKYVPEIGEPLKMLCRFQEPKMNIPMKCIKVI